MKGAGSILFACLVVVGQSCYAASAPRALQYRGTTWFAPVAATAHQTLGPEIHPGPEFDAHFDRLAKGSVSPARVPSSHVPTPADSVVLGLEPGVGFDGLTHLEQRLASNGNQFSTEPPDQALAVGNGFVVEAVNTAIRVRSSSGAILAPAVSLNAFFGLAPAIDRNTGMYGAFTSDPRAYYDTDTQRWFVTMLEIDQDPVSGNFLPKSAVFIAVSQSADPTGLWSLYSLDTTNAGDPVNHPGCPCLGDQPLIGADRHGFYITTNEFPLFTGGFNGAQVYAMSKAKLAGSVPSLSAVAFSSIPLAEGQAYSLQPATTAPGDAHASGQNGTEYLLSALDFNNSLDNRIAVWALTNTQSLDSASPAVVLQSAIVGSEVYGAPPSAQQMPGPTPLAELIESGYFGKASTQSLPLIDGNDDRMQQVTWADGKLWSSLNSVVKPANGVVESGAAYFIVAPSWSGNVLGGRIAKQGYLSVSNNALLYPAIGVNRVGKGVMTFSVVGGSVFPSAAYAPIDALNGAGAIHFAAFGAAPDDGFSGYAFFGSRVGRWGDYSAAVADADGSIWFATEYIPGGPRTVFANWGTFIGHVTP